MSLSEQGLRQKMNLGDSPEEGTVAKSIESVTSHIPSDVFLWAATAAIGGSLMLKMSGKDRDALFVGQWVAPFLLLGVYNKIVKVAGSDSKSC